MRALLALTLIVVGAGTACAPGRVPPGCSPGPITVTPEGIDYGPGCQLDGTTTTTTDPRPPFIIEWCRNWGC
jgi:hypothetical protein